MVASMENSLPDDRQVLFVMSAAFSFVVSGVLTFLHVFHSMDRFRPIGAKRVGVMAKTNRRG